MSARRLAEQQPESFELSPENRAKLDRIISKYPEGKQASAVISALWIAQKQNDYWLPRAAIETVADTLGMPYIRVLEVATFYTMFNLEPVGKHFIQMCGTTPCMLAGSDSIKDVLEKRIGEQRKVTADGLFSWLEVECLGACCNAPMVQINDDYYEDLTAENFNKLLDDLSAGRPVKTGSQKGRVASEPIGGRITALASLYGEDGRSGPGSVRAAPSAGDPAAAAQEKRAQDREPSALHPAQTRVERDAAQSVGHPPAGGQRPDTRTETPVSEKGRQQEAEEKKD
jgi:NADH-quinone oxidoreductase subunit E